MARLGTFAMNLATEKLDIQPAISVEPETYILKIALAVPLYNLFDYLPPAEPIAAPWVRGLRLLVPFSNSTKIGILWELASHPQYVDMPIKAALKWIDTTPLWSVYDLDLLAWTASYYQHPLGEVLNLALPTRLREKKLVEPKQPKKSRKPNQGISISVELTPPQIPILNSDQATAVAAITATLGRFCPFLLEGITGSGKTEIYLRLTEQVISNHNQVLILVPEIGLIPQMQQRLTQRLNISIALLHSSRTETTREADWLAARAGAALVVLGTRLAVFTPMPRLALIIVDEEHDLAFKQQEGLRYSARDLAVWRAQQQGCPIVLGSATPSLESLNNVIKGRYTSLKLPVRAGVAISPSFDLIDIRSVPLKAGLSPILIRLIKENLARSQQSLLFLNRRGYAPLLICYACGWIAVCSKCDARLTLHKEAGVLWCHHCGIQHPQPHQCPTCNHLNLKAIGQGTQRLEQTLIGLFGDVPIIRIDRDNTTHRGSLESLLAEAHTGGASILLGTQMLAKGHDFSEVTLVGIIDLDQGLYGVDYRASERMAQLIIQVAGRSGRASKPGRVVLQSRHPDHPMLQALIKHGYRAFANMAMCERQQAQLPPFSAQALLRAEGKSAIDSLNFLEQAASAAEGLAHKPELWGPAPAPMERRAGQYRYNLLLQSSNRVNLQKFLTLWIAKICHLPTSRRVRWSIDVDPQELL